MSFLDKILRIGEGRTLKKLERLADQVDALEDDFRALTDEELQDKTAEFKERLTQGESLDDLMVEAFATVREAAARTLHQRHFHVQIMGGAALHLGNIAEMKTGEGKTLVATLPSYLRALTGDGVHVVTVNDYLASYQAELMGRVYRFLGMSIGCVMAGQDPIDRREQYNADITYGTNNEFGFDYLRDNMAQRPQDLVQRGHNFVIVDEVDSILIDEARTPLIISGPATGDINRWYTEFARIVKKMQPGVDYEVDEKKRTVGVLETGIEKVEDELGVENLYEAANTPLIGFLNNAIKAKELFHLDKDYIVKKGEVLIVDEHTGRVLPGRRYNEGMHQAIEAKEGVVIKAENQTLATITLQNYFRLYPEGSRSGMTGTAETEAAEFSSTYSIGVVPIPTNMPMIREDNPDLIYPTEAGKLRAVVEDISERYHAGQPVLVGTTSVEKSEDLSRELRKAGVVHEVLNAKQHEREASVVAMAGRKGAVTVATNMAGRGTDIMLGGNAEHIAVTELSDRGLDPKENAKEYEALWPEVLEEAQRAVAAEHNEVVELGGLYVLGTERHESRRIDNQLRGRSGRQGDPGESRFYLSMEDDLMRLFNSNLAARLMQADSYPEDQPLESKAVSKGIASAQSQVEARNFEIRKNVLKYDDVMTEQRQKVYDQRRRVLEGEDLSTQIDYFIEELAISVVQSETGAEPPEKWDLDTIWATLRSFYSPELTPEDIISEIGTQKALTKEYLVDQITIDMQEAYEKNEAELADNPIAVSNLGENPMAELERRVVLETVDRLWREHLYEMDYLKEGIGLRAMAQRDPLVEYADEGAHMFTAMMGRIKEESIQGIFSLTQQFANAKKQLEEVEASKATKGNQNLAAGAQAALETSRTSAGKRGAKSQPGKNAAAKPTIMGDLGHAAIQQRLNYSGPQGQPEPTATDSFGNRQQRRAKSKAKKKRR